MATLFTHPRVIDPCVLVRGPKGRPVPYAGDGLAWNRASALKFPGVSNSPNKQLSGLLSSWKEVASYLNRGMRTVQRWERFGLPVHRMGDSSRAPVFAFANEIEGWLRNAPSSLGLTNNHDARLSTQRAKLTSRQRRLIEFAQELRHRALELMQAVEVDTHDRGATADTDTLLSTIEKLVNANISRDELRLKPRPSKANGNGRNVKSHPKSNHRPLTLRSSQLQPAG